MFLSIIIVARNEEEYIEECLDSVFEQLSELDLSLCEIIVVDSMSNDNTILLATQKLEDFGLIKFKILSNEGVTLTKGWNIGLRVASGKYVLRPDAHAEFKDEYINIGLNILEDDSSIDAVGGVLETKIRKKGFFSESILFFLTSSIGMGNSNFRVGKKSGFFDTVLYAIYKRSLFIELGYFDESLHRHEDTEMHGRLISSGKKLYTCGDMVAVYYARDSLDKLSKQMYANGYYSYEMPVSGGLKLRHHIPGLFFGGLLVLLLLSFYKPFFGFMFIFFVTIYLLSIFYFSVKKRRKNIKLVMNDLLVVTVGHSSYAYGYFKGLIKRFINKPPLN